MGELAAPDTTPKSDASLGLRLEKQLVRKAQRSALLHHLFKHPFVSLVSRMNLDLCKSGTRAKRKENTVVLETQGETGS